MINSLLQTWLPALCQGLWPILRIKILQAYKYTFCTSVSSQSAIGLTSPYWRIGTRFSFFHSLPFLSVAHTPSSPSFISYFSTNTPSVCLPLLESLPSSFTLCLLYFLAWQNVLIGNKLWEGLQSEVETASDLPLMVAFLPSLAALQACVQWLSAHAWKDGAWKRPNNSPMAGSSQIMTGKGVKCSQAAECKYETTWNFLFVQKRLIRLDLWHMYKLERHNNNGETPLQSTAGTQVM